MRWPWSRGSTLPKEHWTRTNTDGTTSHIRYQAGSDLHVRVYLATMGRVLEEAGYTCGPTEEAVPWICAYCKGTHVKPNRHTPVPPSERVFRGDYSGPERPEVTRLVEELKAKLSEICSYCPYESSRGD